MIRPDRPILGNTPRTKTGCGWLYIIDNTEDEYQEVFFRLGKPGGCPQCFLQALGMIVSLALRGPVTKADVVKAFKDIQCPNPMWSGRQHNLSCPDAIAKVLEKTLVRSKNDLINGEGQEATP